MSTPALADLDAATAAIADPDATLADVEAAAEAEEAAYLACPDRPQPEPEIEI